MRHIILILILLVSSCMSTGPVQKLNPTVYYKNDICFSYEKSEDSSKKKGFIRTFFRNKKKLDIDEDEGVFCGVGVLPYQESYKIRIESVAKINLFAMTTCHREVTTENPDKGIFKKNGVVENLSALSMQVSSNIMNKSMKAFHSTAVDRTEVDFTQITIK